jgi:hypothetical protein
MQIDFIKVPYTTGPGMIKNTGSVFISSPNLDVLKLKKDEFKKYGKDLYGQMSSVGKIVERSANYCGVYTDQIQDLSLALEEDVAVMYQGQLAAICFCFPSGFIPSSKVGLPLSEIHNPVADGDLLRKASPGIARVMTEQESFKRWVWTVTTNPNLSNHPNSKIDNQPKNIEDLYFRYETQTTARIDNDTSLFFVKVNVVPLKDVYNQKIIDSINSMSTSVLEYKNLTEIKKLLNSL